MSTMIIIAGVFTLVVAEKCKVSDLSLHMEVGKSSCMSKNKR